ncbi:hypothetical protein MMC24_007707 [Lignoscripta atroalba]|nr:hypothetical protein [Lignoscripta atroalba]
MFSTSSRSGHADAASGDLDTMLHDVSSRMARAQLARQVSSSSSVNLKRRAARILKTNSAGTSPQHLQRRRTTASHKTTSHLSELHPSNVAMPQHAVGNVPALWPTSARPVSWHPSSMAYRSEPPPASNYDLSMIYPTTGYQTMAVNGLSTPMTQPDLNGGMPIDCGFSLDGSSATYQSSASGFMGYPPLNANNTAYFPYNQLNSMNLAQYPSVPIPQDYPTKSSLDYSKAWSDSLSAAPAMTAPPTPDFLPIQYPPETWPTAHNTPVPHLPKKRSKELVGMGLYDSPDKGTHSMSGIVGTDTFGFLVETHHGSVGKGLKLEETWQPPEEDKGSDTEEDGDDAYSVEEGEEELPVNTTRDVIKDGIYSGYGDLSNQSFLFDNEDSCFDGMAFDQQMSSMAPPKALDARFENFTWI